MACRSKVNGEAAVKDVQTTTGCKTVELGLVDLTKFASITAFVDELKNSGVNQLDSVLINAGMMTPKFTPTADGWEIFRRITSGHP